MRGSARPYARSRHEGVDAETVRRREEFRRKHFSDPKNAMTQEQCESFDECSKDMADYVRAARARGHTCKNVWTLRNDLLANRILIAHSYIIYDTSRKVGPSGQLSG